MVTFNIFPSHVVYSFLVAQGKCCSLLNIFILWDHRSIGLTMQKMKAVFFPFKCFQKLVWGNCFFNTGKSLISCWWNLEGAEKWNGSYFQEQHTAGSSKQNPRTLLVLLNYLFCWVSACLTPSVLIYNRYLGGWVRRRIETSNTCEISKVHHCMVVRPINSL